MPQPFSRSSAPVSSPVAQNETQRGADKDIGRRGQRGHHLFDVPDAAEIGERDEQRDLLLGAAKKAHRLGFVRRRIASRSKRLKASRQAFARRRREHACETRGIGADQPPEIGRMIGDGAQQAFDALVERPEIGLGQKLIEPRFGLRRIGDPRRIDDQSA